MNKLLPILLVVVLSACSSSGVPYSAKCKLEGASDNHPSKDILISYTVGNFLQQSVTINGLIELEDVTTRAGYAQGKMGNKLFTYNEAYGNLFEEQFNRYNKPTSIHKYICE